MERPKPKAARVSKAREWWIDFRDNGDAEVVHDGPPKHIQGECIHVLESTPARANAERLLEALKAIASVRYADNQTQELANVCAIADEAIALATPSSRGEK
jgi:hypothetical protein